MPAFSYIHPPRHSHPTSVLFIRAAVSLQPSPKSSGAERPSRAGREERCSGALWLIYEETFCGCGRWRPIRPRARVSPGVFVFRGASRARWCFSMGLMKSSSAPNTQAMRWALKARLSRLRHRQFAFAPIYSSKMVFRRQTLDCTHSAWTEAKRNIQVPIK